MKPFDLELELRVGLYRHFTAERYEMHYRYHYGVYEMSLCLENIRAQVARKVEADILADRIRS